MSQSLDSLFLDLERAAERLHKLGDNEAARHDLLVRPILTHELALGWQQGEALAQQELPLAPEVLSSYYWKGAAPRKRRPDILLVPYSIAAPVGVVEEKRQQQSMSRLEAHMGQLLEYQYLHRCVWGLLTDGERWVLTRNHEIFHRFDGLIELRRRLRDLQQCIGREAILDRLRRYGTADLVYIRPSPTLILVGSISESTSATTLQEFLRAPTKQARDLVVYLFTTTRGAVYRKVDELGDPDVRELLITVFGSGLSNYATPVVMGAEIAMADDSTAEDMRFYVGVVERFCNAYPTFRNFADALLAKGAPSAGLLAEFVEQVYSTHLLSRCSTGFLEEARQHCRNSQNKALHTTISSYLANRTY